MKGRRVIFPVFILNIAITSSPIPHQLSHHREHQMSVVVEERRTMMRWPLIKEVD